MLKPHPEMTAQEYVRSYCYTVNASARTRLFDNSIKTQTHNDIVVTDTRVHCFYVTVTGALAATADQAKTCGVYHELEHE
jgi:hypothetical protein